MIIKICSQILRDFKQAIGTFKGLLSIDKSIAFALVVLVTLTFSLTVVLYSAASMWASVSN
jgi:hypothetical protein